MNAIQFDRHGGPEVLQFRDIERPTPSDGEVLVRVHAAGLNYIDTYHRSGYYPVRLYRAGSASRARASLKGRIDASRLWFPLPVRINSIVRFR